MSDTPALPTAHDIFLARHRLGVDVRRTQLVPSAWLSSLGAAGYG